VRGARLVKIYLLAANLNEASLFVACLREQTGTQGWNKQRKHNNNQRHFYFYMDERLTPCNAN